MTLSPSSLVVVIVLVVAAAVLVAVGYCISHRRKMIKETITYRMDGYDGVISRAPPSRNGGRTASSRSARAGWGETGCASDIQLPEEERQSIMRRVGSGELTVDQAMSIFNQVETQIKGDGADGGGPPAPAATVPGSTTRRKKAVATEVVGFDGPTHTHVAKAPRPKQHAADGIAPPPARGSAGWMMTAPGVVDGVLPGGAESIGPSALPPWSPGLHATIPPSVISAPFSLETTRARDSKRARQAGPDSTSFTSSGFALGSPATPAGRNRTGIPRQTSRTTATISALDGGRTPGGSRSRGSISRTVDRADAKPSAPRAIPAAPSQPSHRRPCCISISPLVNIEGDVPVEFAANACGDRDALAAIIASSKVLRMVNGRIDMAPRGVFVFGGNAVGNGTADSEVANLLLVLKLRHPDRVHLLMGSNDVQPLRFASELAPGESGSQIDVYWGKRHVPFGAWLAATNGGLPDTTVNTAKWMLECTMDAPQGFENRRKELAGPARAGVTDDEVVNSFVDSVHPSSHNPWLLRYLNHCCVAVVAGKTIFTHAPLSVDRIGAIPGSSTTANEPDEWVRALASFVRTELEGFEASPRWRGELLKRRRGGEALIHYSLPGGFEGQSLLDASNVGPNTSHPGQVRAWLKVMKLSAVDARHYDPNKGELLDVHSSPQMKRRLQSAPSAPSTPTPRTPVRAKPIKHIAEPPSARTPIDQDYAGWGRPNMALGTISESSLPKTAKATALFPPTKKLRAAGGTAGNPAATRPATLMSPQRQASARAYIQNLDIGAMTFDSSSSEEDERTTYV